ncbi:hypothetical protein N184_15985 [Sinorhizobium sp. GL28]|nr:hypothetical protein N184_15985 [Sinorhizobium sp. GL28]
MCLRTVTEAVTVGGLGTKFGALTWLGPEADAKEKVLFDQCRAVSNR